MTSTALLPLLGLVVTMVMGAVAQRTTGMGFALLIAPFLVLALGPVEGILVTNVFGVLSSCANLALMWRDVDWPRAAVLAPMGLVGVLPGALAVRLLPPAPLAVAVSALILLALVATLLLRGRTLPRSRALAAGGGFASGFLNVTSGAGGPGLVVYARATGWPHHLFAATAQLQFIVLGAASLAAKWALPSLSGLEWAVMLGALAAGIGIGSWLAPKVQPDDGMRIVMALALVGALLALGRGLLQLL